MGVARPRPERAEELQALLVSFLAPTRAESGCIAYALHRNDDGDFVFYEHWRSSADLLAHLDLAPLRAFQQRRMEYLASELEITWLEPLG